MKKRILYLSVFFVILSTLFVSINSKKSDYVTRNESQMKTLYSYVVPGGKKAAGMSEYFNSIRANIATGTVSPEEYFNALNASNQVSSKRAINATWNELGPDNVGGRTRAFLQDKDSSSVMYVGGVSGGLFRSTSRGSSWSPVNDLQENLNVSSITQSSNGNIVYGTGEGQFVSVDGTLRGTPGFQGFGMFISTNRGRTFTNIPSTRNFGNISSLAAEPAEFGTRIYASTDAGVQYSDDGLTWTRGRTGASKEVKVATNGHIYAQIGSNIFKSTDRGSNWTTITPENISFVRASIAISPEDPNYVYLMTSNNASRLEGVYRSMDGGTSWTKIINTGSIYFDPLSNSLQGQGNFNNVITVNPRDKNHIIMGGVFLAEWKINTNPRYIASLNDFGGANPTHVHADKHVLQWDMSTTPPTLIIGCDGGLFFSSDNLRTYAPKNFGFNATQFYYVSADYDGNVTGGTQDNGSLYINKKGNTSKSAVEIRGGDGFTSHISTKDKSIIFSSSYYGNITRSKDFGRTQLCVWDRRIARAFTGLTDTAEYCGHNNPASWAPFNTKYILWEHPDYENKQSRLFFARYGQVWMAEGITNFDKEPNWYLIANSQGNGEVWDMEVTPDGSSLFISNSSTIWRVDGLNTATYLPFSPELSIPPGITMTNLNFNSGGRSITSVNLDPRNSNKALITIGNYGGGSHVFVGNNMLGTPSYTNITNNIPDMPVYDGVITYASSNSYFVGTDLGIFASDDGGNTWTSQSVNSKYPRVPTISLRQFYFPYKSQGAIYAGTHGRGFFECVQYRTSLKESVSKKLTQALSAYPNPANDIVTVKFDSPVNEKVTLNVIDINGKVTYSHTHLAHVGTNSVSFETALIKSGVYVITSTGSKGGNTNNGSIKLVIRR
jgi:photosystem II stability/assembly factor-like uncharacterized protein